MENRLVQESWVCVMSKQSWTSDWAHSRLVWWWSVL